jgi:hypothetical protein
MGNPGRGASQWSVPEAGSSQKAATRAAPRGAFSQGRLQRLTGGWSVTFGAVPWGAAAAVSGTSRWESGLMEAVPLGGFGLEWGWSCWVGFEPQAFPPPKDENVWRVEIARVVFAEKCMGSPARTAGV